MIRTWFAILTLLPAAALAADAPLFYLPFDGATDAVVAGADSRERAGAVGEFVPGVRGSALLVKQDLRYAAKGSLSTREGTLALWARPNWPGGDPAGHTLFSLYGGAASPPGWQANRFGLVASGGRLTFSVHTSAGRAVGVSAPIADWRAGEWHHVAVTWKNVGTGRANGEIRLYVDGVEGAPALTGGDLPMGPVSEFMDIGRDSDASPDYADAVLDDLYIYGRALSAAEIAHAVSAARASEAPLPPARIAPRITAPGWADPERPYRVEVVVPAERRARQGVFAALPLDLAGDLAALGIPGTPHPASLRLVAAAPRAAPISVGMREGRLEWAVGDAPAGQVRRYRLYFRTLAYDFSTPLLARAAAPLSSPPAAAAAPDYATDAYGDAWDFDEGDTEEIDQWGNKPEFIRGRTVEEGVLKLDVSDDPWFIWGDMWGQVPRSQRPVRIDLDRYPLLEMRLRQSVSQATWELFGRPEGSTSLLRCEFTVSGSGWQTVRVDLRRQAGWGGVLNAFRIDPTGKVDAHVEFDWVRLTRVTGATRGAVEALGGSAARAAQVGMLVPRRSVRAGEEQTVTVRARDAAGRPLARHPVRLAILPGSGGALDGAPGAPSLAVDGGARRALTGPDGSASFRYRASKRAGATADRLEAAAEFSAAAPARQTVEALPGPPHHYALEPALPKVLRPGDPPLAVVARLVDADGNPLPGGGRGVQWSAPGARLRDAEAKTRPDGSSRALFVVDPTRQWVTRVSVRDAKGLTGETAPLSAIPAGPRPEAVRLGANGYFTAAGKPWLPLGGFYANWVQVPTPDGEWDRRVSFTDATEEQIVAWLRFLKENGVTAQRFMLRTHRRDGMEPMDIGGRVNPGLFASFLRYLDLARPFGIRFLLVLHEDYTKPMYYHRGALERYCLPWFAGLDAKALPPFQRRFLRDGDLLDRIDRKYTDADAIACQDQYAREIVSLVKDNPLVFGYELENEMVECPAAWANHALETIRGVDPRTPLCVSHGGGGLHTADPEWWKAKTSIDFYTYHLYPHGSTSPEMDYGIALDVLTRYGRLGKPAFLGESSGDQFAYHPDRETRRWTMRDIIWFSLTNGNPGCFFWNARGSEVAEFKLANEIAGRIDWQTFRRKRPAVAVAVPHPLDDDKWFRTDAGRAAYAMMGRYSRHYLDRGVDFDFVLDASAYPLRAGVETFAPPEPPRAGFGISPGFQLNSLVREGDGEALLYARNFARAQLWETDRPSNWKQYLRARRPAPLKVTVNLPGAWRVDLWDLDTGRHEERTLASGETLDLGATDHDFALHLVRR